MGMGMREAEHIGSLSYRLHRIMLDEYHDGRLGRMDDTAGMGRIGQKGSDIVLVLHAIV